MAALPDMGDPVADAIDAAWASREEEERTYLGASVAGRPCDRELWYSFRWAVEPEAFSGRMLRLFDTGHVEEARMIAWLRDAGMTVAEVDPATGEQWAITFADGHGGGHADGRVTGVPGAPVVDHLLECKTHNDRSFTDLKKHGVKVAKPEHYAQMQLYMHGLGLTRALYLAKNKNTDELRSERVRYDADFTLKLLARLERIRDAHVAPPRIADDPAAFACRFCKKVEVCHNGTEARRNCRTCLHSTPVAGGAWHCDKHDRELSKEEQAAGCASHRFLPALVPFMQTDVDGEFLEVSYLRPDGTVWIDRGPQP